MQSSLTIDDMADDVLALLDGLNITSAHLVGHALGGLIGMALALRAPDRLDRLVVVNGWGRLEAHTARCFDTRLTLLRTAGPEAFVRAQPIFLYPANWLALDAPAALLDDAAQLEHFPGAAVAEQRIAAVCAFDMQDRLGEIVVPLLALSAEDDLLVPSIASSRIVDRLAMDNAGTHVAMPWGGHACNVTDPETFDRIVIDFLRS